MRKPILWLVMFAAACLLAACSSDQTGQMSQADTDSMGTVSETPPTEMEGTAESKETTPTTEQKPATEAVTKPATKPATKPSTVTVQIPESTAVVITLVDSIDTDIQVAGDQFAAELASPIVIDGRTAFAAGAHVEGVLDSVVESGRLKTPAELGFRIVSIADAQGNPVPITTYQIFEKKEGKTGRDAAMIGGGAVVGGIIGKITGKKGGTEIGAVAGAAAGAATAAATGKDDIVHSAGTQVTFFLAAPLSVKVAQ